MKEGSHGLRLSPRQRRRGVAMTHGFTLLDGEWGSGHGLCPSALEWRSVVMVTPSLFVMDGGKGAMVSASLLLPHPSSRREAGRKQRSLLLPPLAPDLF